MSLRVTHSPVLRFPCGELQRSTNSGSPLSPLPPSLSLSMKVAVLGTHCFLMQSASYDSVCPEGDILRG